MESSSDIKPQLAAILNIPNSAAWSIHDKVEEENLYLVHYVPNADQTQYGKVRGLLVDLKTKTVYANSYGYTPSYVQDQLNLKNLGVKEEEVKIKMGYEGTILRFVKHNGKVYRLTHRKINTEKSHWGNSLPFPAMYRELEGPSDDQIFDSTKKWSPFVHFFIVVHPGVLNVTRQDIGKGYLVYLGAQTMWDSKSGLYPQDETEMEPKSIKLEGNVRAPKELTLEEANLVLSPSPAVDRRLSQGEFVMLYRNDSPLNGSLIKVESVAYRWRMDLRNDDPNLYHQFTCLLTSALLNPAKETERQSYLSQFPLLTPVQLDQFPLPVRHWPFGLADENETTDILSCVEGRMYNVWLSFLMVVPLDRQAEVATYYDTLMKSREELIHWVKSLAKWTGLEHSEYPKRIKEVILEALTQANRSVQEGKNRGKNMAQITSGNIDYLLRKERGKSLYQLIKAMEDERKGKKNFREPLSRAKDKWQATFNEQVIASSTKQFDLLLQVDKFFEEQGTAQAGAVTVERVASQVKEVTANWEK